MAKGVFHYAYNLESATGLIRLFPDRQMGILLHPFYFERGPKFGQLHFCPMGSLMHGAINFGWVVHMVFAAGRFGKDI